MPLPKQGESKQNYIARFMGDPDMRRKYPSEKQRAALAYSEFTKKQRNQLGSFAAPGGSNTYIPDLPRKRRMKKEEDEQFVYLFDVPLLDEHETTVEGEDGEPRKEVYDRERLQRIIDACNFRIEDTGDTSLISDGHTTPGAPSSEQPPQLGEVTRFHLGRLGRLRPRACILGDFKIPKDKWQRARQLRRRSVEIWRDADGHEIIDPVAFLDIDTPKRDLTPMQYSRAGEKYRYEIAKHRTRYRQEEIIMPDYAAIVDEVLKQLSETDWAKWCQERMAADQAPQMEREADGGSGGGGSGMDDEGEEHIDEPTQKFDKRERYRMEADQLRTQVSRFQRENEDMKTQLATMEKTLRLSARERDLVQLESEGVQLDRKQELDYVSDLPEDRYAAHLDIMRTRYQRAPITPVPTNLRVPGDGKFSAQDRERCVQLVKTQGISFEQAMQQIKADA